MIMNLERLKEQNYYQKYTQKKNITPKTLHSYDTALVHFCNANNKTLDTIIEETLEEQYPFIDEYGRIHEYNPNHANIDTYLYNTVTYLRKRDNSNSSIIASLNRIRSVLSQLDIKLPKNIELADDTKKWNALTKEDIQYVISISPLYYRALIVFLAHTGIRLGDAVNFTIEDFMKATYSYHKTDEIIDFLENAPQDMVGFWEFKPKKTLKHDIECKVYNTAESNNLLLESLHRRVNSINNYNKKTGKDLKLEKSDGLFSSKKTNFKGPILPDSCSIFFGRKNKDLYKYHERNLRQQLEKDLISNETYQQKISQIPKFHAHGLRKFFITTLARKRVDLRASALMEGHKPPMQHDRSYVDNANLDDLLFDEYNRIVPAISFLKTEEDYLLSKTNRELNLENSQLKEENKQLQMDKVNIKNDFKKEAKKLLDELLKENNITL